MLQYIEIFFQYENVVKPVSLLQKRIYYEIWQS